MHKFSNMETDWRLCDLPQECKMWLIYENQCNVWKIQAIWLSWYLLKNTQENSTYIHDKNDVNKLDVKGL